MDDLIRHALLNDLARLKISNIPGQVRILARMIDTIVGCGYSVDEGRMIITGMMIFDGELDPSKIMALTEVS